MGLDNWIEVKDTKSTSAIPELQQFKGEYLNNFEICYWRKCYNIRKKIIEALWDKWSNTCCEMQVYDGQLDAHDIEVIIDVLQSFNSDNWNDAGGSIWDWDDEEWPYSEHVQRDIENLKIVRTLMDQYKLEVWFYDSY